MQCIRFIRLYTFYLSLFWPDEIETLFPIKDLASNYMFKINDRNTRTRCEICSKLTVKIPERRQWHRSGIFIVNFEHISHLVLVFLLLNLSR